MAAALPSFLVSDVSTALMVMELGAGGNSGAVYIPLASMVPRVAFPPAIPLIDQFTAGFDPSPVFAVNCCCATPGMDAARRCHGQRCQPRSTRCSRVAR